MHTLPCKLPRAVSVPLHAAPGCSLFQCNTSKAWQSAAPGPTPLHTPPPPGPGASGPAPCYPTPHARCGTRQPPHPPPPALHCHGVHLLECAKGKDSRGCALHVPFCRSQQGAAPAVPALWNTRQTYNRPLRQGSNLIMSTRLTAKHPPLPKLPRPLCRQRCTTMESSLLEDSTPGTALASHLNTTADPNNSVKPTPRLLTPAPHRDGVPARREGEREHGVAPCM